MILNSAAWGWGYAGMWAGKWIMADLLTGSNTVRTALNTVIYRMTGETQSITDVEGTYTFALSHIFNKSVDRAVWILGILAIFLLCICVFGKKVRYASFKDYAAAIAAIAIVGVVPFVWFFVVRNHTIIHPHLEYRQLAVSLWAVLVMLAMPFSSAGLRKEA